MKFKCPLVAVNDMDTARNFYENILNQKVKYDFGENIVFEGDFSIQLKSHFANMISINEDDISLRSNNFELYSEEEDIDDFVKRLSKYKEIEYIHNLIEHSWGQRVIRFYDPDMNIVEVGESMESVVKRFLNQGLSIDETAKLTQYPIGFVDNINRQFKT